MKRDKKVPHHKHCSAESKDKKVPRIERRRDDIYPSWRFSSVDLRGPFSWPRGKVDELKILEKLHQFDGMTWDEIVRSGNHHVISIQVLSKDAKNRLIEIQQDDIAEVFSFRLTGRWRIICIKNDGVAKLLWSDPDHQVCLCPKKHT